MLPSVFGYTNYRSFLKDCYRQRKAQDPTFSYRVFQGLAGFSSPNFLKLVMDGKKNLGRKSIIKIARGMELKKKETRYFTYLVLFNQAKRTVDRNRYFEFLSRFKKGSRVTRIRTSQYDYYSQWYNCVIRELVNNRPADTDTAELAQEVFPAVLPKQAKKSVKLLEELGLIKKGKDGNYVQTAPLISTGAEVTSLAVRNFNTKMIGLAKDAVESVPREKREISSVTMKVSVKGFKKVQKRIRECKAEIMDIVAEDTGVDRVYQANFQLFPVSRFDEKKRRN